MESSYPTKSELETIEKWDGTPRELIEYVGGLWSYRTDNDWVVRNGRDIMNRKTHKVDFSTWGWSGNEDIVESLKGSWFWMLFWWSSRRGGHFELQITPYWIDRKSPNGYGKINTPPPLKDTPNE